MQSFLKSEKVSNFLLHNDSLGNYNEFVSGMLELISINIDEYDRCYKNSTIYNNNHFTKLCSNYGQTEQTIATFIERNLNPLDGEANSDGEIDLLFVRQSNGFLGISFNTQTIAKIRQIINQSSYDVFKEEERKSYVSTTFWDNRRIIFPNLVFCKTTKDQIENKGTSKEFYQIINRLQSLDNYSRLWKNSNLEFNVNACNHDTNLNVSRESESTLNNPSLKRLRYFTIPNGESKLFEIHIKTGNLRIHIYPDEADRSIYVGYIGPHLDI